MITIQRTYTITLLDSNIINYNITSNKSCITIVNASGSFNGTTKKIYVTYNVTDLDCFTSNLITINVTNDKACSNSFTDTLKNECNNLDVSIEQPDSNNLLFNAIASGGKPPYLYNWVYDLQAQFSSNEPNTGFHSQKQLSLSWNHNPANILPPGYKNPQGVSVKVKDANGCISEALNYYTLTCEPFIASQTIAAQCFPLITGDIRRFILSLTNSGCGSLVNNPLVITYTGATQRSLGNNSYEITVPEFSTTSIILPITVTNDKNIPSNTFNVTVTKTGTCKIKPDCAAGFILNNYISNTKTLQFDNSASSITDFVDFATDYIDYSTFTFVASAGQVLTNATTLTITSKGVATFDATTKLITYTQTTANVSVIPIKWKVKNECDIFSQEFTLNINSVLSVAPVVNNITKTLFLGDLLTTTVTDTSSVTVTKFIIVSNPSVGNVSISSTGVITYNPISYSATNQVLTLKPVNQYGKSGANFTITYTILSPGIALPLTICSLTNPYSLFNLLQSNTYTTGGVWTTTSGLTITSNQVTIANPGLYNFTYTVTNSTNSTTKSTSTSINYISLSISDVDVTYLTSNTRKIKITTVGFTETQLQLITYVDVRVISPSVTLTITRNAIISRTGNILYTDIDLTDPVTLIVKTDYNFVEVSIPSELNDCSNPITRTYNKNPKLLTSIITASVNVTGTITKVQKVVVSLTSALTASVTIPSSQISVSVNRFTFDADYLMIQYKFTDGTDLDTRTRIVSPNIGQDTTSEYIGFSAQSCGDNSDYNTNGIYPIGSTFSGNNYILKHGCDNQGTGFEAVLVNLINFKSSIINPTHYNASEITIDCRAWWYPKPDPFGVNKVKLFLTLWKGGSLVSPTFNTSGLSTHYTFTNPSAVPPYGNTFVIESDGNVVPGPRVAQAPNNNNGYRVGVIKYNLNTFVGTIDNNDTTTPIIT
jgi:hypothetical protein